jgi:hypothetical protein
MQTLTCAFIGYLPQGFVAYGSDTIELPAHHTSTQHSRDLQNASSDEALQQQNTASAALQPHQQRAAVHGKHKKKNLSSQQHQQHRHGSTSSSQYEAPLQYPGMLLTTMKQMHHVQSLLT